MSDGRRTRLGKTPSRVATDYERVMQLRSLNYSYRQVAAELDIDASTALRWEQKGVETLTAPVADTWRVIQLERYEHQLSVLTYDEESGAVAESDRRFYLALMERVDRITGTAAPERIEAAVVHLTPDDLRLKQDLLHRSASDAAAAPHASSAPLAFASLAQRATNRRDEERDEDEA